MITRTLILINVAVFIWEVVFGKMDLVGGGFTNASPVAGGVLWPLAITAGHQYYRLITCGFLHAGLMHIAVNMISLWSLGTFIERIVGSLRMFLIYFVSLIGASICVVLFSAPDVPTLGASGAIFGLFGALFAIGFKLGRPGMQLVRANIGILILNLVFTFAIPFISKFAHVGGLLVGFAFTYAIFFPPRPVYAQVVDANTGETLESHVETP